MKIEGVKCDLCGETSADENPKRWVHMFLQSRGDAWDVDVCDACAKRPYTLDYICTEAQKRGRR